MKSQRQSENPGAVGGRRLGVRAMRERAKARDVELLPSIEALQRQGITSARALAKALNDRGVRAPEGGDWQATQVLRLLKRVAKG
jgi:hypothetical protein